MCGGVCGVALCCVVLRRAVLGARAGSGGRAASAFGSGLGTMLLGCGLGVVLFMGVCVEFCVQVVGELSVVHAFCVCGAVEVYVQGAGELFVGRALVWRAGSRGGVV